MNKRDEAVWSAVEADFRGGALSNRQISKRHGVSESAIRKRSEAEGWVRTLAESAQSAHFGDKPRFTPVSAPETRETPRPKTGERLAQSHVELGCDLAFRLLDELDATTSHVGELEQAIVE